MARKRKTRSRRRRGFRRGESNLIWYFAIGACSLVIGGVLGAAQMLLSDGKMDERTLCHAGGPINVTAILLDLTDPLNETQQTRLKAIVNNEIEASSTDTMIALGVVSEDSSRWGALFAKCKPETGDEASVLYENPALIADQYRSDFLRPVNETLETTLISNVENQSPIMEALQSLVVNTPGFSRASGRRKIIIVSDMLQHSDNLSFYRGQGWDYFIGQNGEQRLAGNLTNTSIEILRIPRVDGNIPSREVVEGFWTRYFDRQGSRPPSVSSLGDL